MALTPAFLKLGNIALREIGHLKLVLLFRT
jgi:hypothetical protein